MALEDFQRGTLGSGTPFFGFTSPNQSGPVASGGSGNFAPAPPSGSSSGGRSFGGGGGGGGRITFRAPVVTGQQTSEFGRADFDAALIDWNRVYTDAQQGIPRALELIDQFAPGGGFGEGLRTTVREEVGKGVARDTASAVAAGASSISSARGLNVLAGREIATQFANIEDMRAQLQIGAFSPYTQMLSNLAQVGVSRPTSGQFIDRITTNIYGGGLFTPPGKGTRSIGSAPKFKQVS